MSFWYSPCSCYWFCCLQWRTLCYSQWGEFLQSFSFFIFLVLFILVESEAHKKRRRILRTNTTFGEKNVEIFLEVLMKLFHPTFLWLCKLKFASIIHRALCVFSFGHEKEYPKLSRLWIWANESNGSLAEERGLGVYFKQVYHACKEPFYLKELATLCAIHRRNTRKEVMTLMDWIDLTHHSPNSRSHVDPTACNNQKS